MDTRVSSQGASGRPVRARRAVTRLPGSACAHGPGGDLTAEWVRDSAPNAMTSTPSRSVVGSNRPCPASGCACAQSSASGFSASSRRLRRPRCCPPQGWTRTLARPSATAPDTEPGAACPMHKSPARSGRSDTDCVVTSACPPQDAALISLATGLGVLPESATVAEPSAVAPVSSSPVSVLSRFALPDAPPPRA